MRTTYPQRTPAPRTGLIDAITRYRAEHEELAAEAREPSEPPEPSGPHAAPALLWLLETGAARILEPVADVEDGRDGARVWIDHEQAAALLPIVPDVVLDDRRMGSGPVLREVLCAVAHHPQMVRARGYVSLYGGRESLRLNIVEIDDPAFVGLVPDIVLKPPAAYVADLSEELRAEYHDDRATCLYSSVVRQQWHLARARYGLRSAECEPLRPDLDWLGFVTENAMANDGGAVDMAELALTIGRQSSVTFRWR